MKKVAVICLAEHREETIHALQNLGIVHVLPSRPPESDELAERTRQTEEAARVRTLLAALPPARHRGEDMGGMEAVASVAELEGQRQRLAETIARHETEVRQLLPWGNFSHAAIESCRAAGLQVCLCQALRGQLPALPAGAVLRVISEQDGIVSFAVVAPAGETLALPETQLPADGLSLAAAQGRLAAARGELARLEQRLQELAAWLPAVDRHCATLEQQLEASRAQAGMGDRAMLAYLEGYLPARQVPALENAARKNGWALRCTDPEADDPLVPTLITVPRWVEPIRVVFHALGIVPGYREIDISAWFLLFFSLFFALLIGDAAYGVLILGGALLLRRRFPHAPPQPFWLFGILGATTLVWGVLTGSYFGIQLDDLPAPLRGLAVPALMQEQTVQRLCFLLGAIHLTVAHLWNALIKGRHPRALGELAWVGVLWGNYLLACHLVLSAPLPGVTVWLYGTGVAGIVMFSDPRRNPFITAGLGLQALVLGLVNSFVDVVSYVRLFAVGVAGLAVEQSFLAIARGLEVAPWLATLEATLILLVGHSLNMVLGALGVLVHGVRLNILEFSGHLGLQWSGIPYRPLRKAEPAAPVSN